MNRIDRITAILIQLQSRKIVRAQDIAERFEISLRTVYRDINTLEEAGIPILSEAGVGYSIMEGYRLPPVMFTREEAIAFLTAEKLMEKLTDSATRKNHRSAMYKVKAVLRSTEKDMLENMESHIEVFQSNTPFNTESVNNILQCLLDSITGKVAARINYTALYSDQTVDRLIEPLGIFYVSGYWRMIAWCHMRKDYRDFRIDRIMKISVTNEGFRKKHLSLKEYIEKTYKSMNVNPVVIQVQKSVAKYLENQKYGYGFISSEDKGEDVEMTFLSASLDGFARWYLMFADKAAIISPLTLKDQVKSLLSAITTGL